MDSKPTLEPIDQSKLRTTRQNSVRASHSTLKDARGVGGLTPSLQVSEKFDSTVGGTPGKHKSGKKTDTLRQTGRSVGKLGAKTGKAGAFGKSGHYAETQSLKTGSVRDKNDDSFDLEDFDEIMEKINLDKVLEEKKSTVRKLKKTTNEGTADYKENFLIKFFEAQGDAFDFIGMEKG